MSGGKGGGLIGGLIGLAVASIPGAWAVGALAGFQIGAGIGELLFPPQAPSSDVGRLTDVRSSGSSMGVPIPTVWGRQRVGCVVVVLGDITEVSPDSGGGKK